MRLTVAISHGVGYRAEMCRFVARGATPNGRVTHPAATWPMMPSHCRDVSAGLLANRKESVEFIDV